MLLVGRKAHDQGKTVSLDEEGLLHHTLVVGQSGSGKSFFVARLIEEIVLNTSARVVIVDPNGDFRSMSVVSDSAFQAHQGAFANVSGERSPDYDVQAHFREAWMQRRFLNLFPNTALLPTDGPSSLNRRLVIHWESLAEEDRWFLLRLGHEPSAAVRTGLDVCIKYGLHLNQKWNSQFYSDIRGIMHIAQGYAENNYSLAYYPEAKGLSVDDWIGVRFIAADLLQRYSVWSSVSQESKAPRPTGLVDFVDSPFSASAPSRLASLQWDALTLALDSAREDDSLLIVDTLLARLWWNAKAEWRRVTTPTGKVNDSRVPTFIVIDEAQNFCPSRTENALRQRVTERILRIASEGRKYGLYLILSTQRPTKLHPSLVPECENSCVLRIQSAPDVRFAIEALGIDENRARNCPTFPKGQGLISGRWLDSEIGIDTRFVPARSSVGGGGLPNSWRQRAGASPPFDFANPLADVRDVVASELSASLYPITFVDLAEIVRAERPDLVKSNWLGRPNFKSLIVDLGIENLQTSNVPPGYVYLRDRHTAPSEGAGVPVLPEVEDDVRAALQEIHKQKSVPLLPEAVFRLIFDLLSEDVQQSKFNLTDLSRSVRDGVHRAGARAARTSISYVIRGVQLSGHQYDPDLPQDSVTLSKAFIKSLLYALEVTDPLEGAQLTKALVHLSGGLLDDDNINSLINQIMLKEGGSQSALQSEKYAEVPPEPSAADMADMDGLL